MLGIIVRHITFSKKGCKVENDIIEKKKDNHKPRISKDER